MFHNRREIECLLTASQIRSRQHLIETMLSCIRQLFEYNIAQRRRILKLLEQVDREDLTRELGVGWGSIHGILVHLMNTEIYWIDTVLRGVETERVLSEECEDMDAISKHWSRVEENTRNLLSDVNEAYLQNVQSVRWDGTIISFTVAKALLHVATHEIHHRGLVIGLLRQMGYDPPDVNML
jgi:uncharacterized damage-inducible protein DinB